jgi:hypothetical protein
VSPGRPHPAREGCAACTVVLSRRLLHRHHLLLLRGLTQLLGRGQEGYSMSSRAAQAAPSSGTASR